VISIKAYALVAGIGLYFFFAVFEMYEHSEPGPSSVPGRRLLVSGLITILITLLLWGPSPPGESVKGAQVRRDVPGMFYGFSTGALLHYLRRRQREKRNVEK
jgi:hypothetical protein